MMPWAFPNRYRGGAEAEEGFGRGADELRIGVNWFSRDAFNNIGFKENRFSADVEMEEPKTVKHQLIEFVRILICIQNCDARNFRTKIPRILSALELHGER